MNRLKTIAIVGFLIAGMSFSYGQSDQNYRELLREMFQYSGTEQVYKTAIKQSIATLKAQEATIPDEFWMEMENPFIDASMDEILNKLTPVYKKHLTEAELRELTEFYKSPLGQKYAKQSPLIFHESAQIGQQWSKEIGLKLIDRLQTSGY